MFEFCFHNIHVLVAAGLGSGLRGPSIVTMAVNQSAVWSVATVDKDDNSIAWCNIKNRDECKKPMLERALELKTGLVLYSSRYDCVEITPSEWTTMDKLADLLQLFHSMTKSMSYRYANAGEIIPFVKILKDYVTDEVTKLKLTGLHTTLLSLNDSFNRRFSKYLNNQNCILATYLDPRHKSVFDDEIEGSIRYLEDVELALISNYLEHKKKQDERDNTVIAENTTGTTNTEPHTDTQEPMNSTENDFDGFKSKKIDIIAWRHAKLFSKKAKSTQPEPSVDTVSLRRLQIQAEISSYKKISPIELESNPFDWWKKHMAIFPCLSEMAQKYLSCPPSSVESERLFSIGVILLLLKDADLELIIVKSSCS